MYQRLRMLWRTSDSTAQVVVLVVLLVAALLLIPVIGFTFGLVGLVLHLVVAGIVGWLADLIVPGKLPGSWLGAVLAGLVGSWLGVRIIGPVGPSLAEVPLIPGLLGAIILAFVLYGLARLTTRGRIA